MTTHEIKIEIEVDDNNPRLCGRDCIGPEMWGECMAAPKRVPETFRGFLRCPACLAAVPIEGGE